MPFYVWFISTVHELYSLVHVEGSLVSREALHEGSSGGGKGEIPLIVIVSVAICGTVLLLLNIVLISCFVHKRRQQQSHGKPASEQKPNPPSEGQYFYFVHLKFIAVETTFTFSAPWRLNMLLSYGIFCFQAAIINLFCSLNTMYCISQEWKTNIDAPCNFSCIGLHFAP